VSDDVDRVRQRVDIVRLVGEQVSLKKAGKDFKGLCPFHDDNNPSFTVSPTIGRYKCWSCGASGDAFDWVMNTQKVDFPEALRLLAKETGVELTERKGPRVPLDETRQAMDAAQAFFRDQFRKSKRAREYCRERNLPDEVIDEWDIGYAPDVGDALASVLAREKVKLPLARDLFLIEKDRYGGYYDRFRGRLVFPIHNQRGEIIAYGGRIIGDGIPKYINSSDTPIFSKSRTLYGLHKAKEHFSKEDRAVVVEGYIDVIACHRAGVETAVAPLGTALSEDHAKTLSRWVSVVVLLFDSDEAGRKAALRSTEVLRKEGAQVRIASMPEGEDPDNVLNHKGPGAVVQAVEDAVAPEQFQLTALENLHGVEKEEFWEQASRVLAATPNVRQRDRYVEQLAAKYPGRRDPAAALRAIHEMVERHRPTRTARNRGRRTPAKAQPTPAASILSRLVSSERAVFQALLLKETRADAWKACADETLFETAVAREIAQSVVGEFPMKPPEGEPSVWISRLSEKLAVDLFTEIGSGDALDYLAPNWKEREEGSEREVLHQAIRHLQRLRERRELHPLSKDAALDDEKLRLLNQKLRQLKGDR
jgi:DNA primase